MSSRALAEHGPRRGLMLVISSPSGAGKTSLSRRLVADHPELDLSISATTRGARKGEEHGREYYFVDRQAFADMVERDEFLEYAEVFGNFYGTHRCILEEARSQGQDLVLDIDVQGARQLRDQIPEAVSIFILAPSREILEQRLRARSEDRDDVIARRLRDAAEEIRQYNRYDYVLINRDLAESDATLKAIVCAERVRRTRIEDRIRPILDTFQV